MTNENQSDKFDTFDDWLRRCPPIAPPVGLRERCIATISPVGTLAKSFPKRARLTMAAKLIAVASSAIAATIFVAWLAGSRNQSVFAQAIEQTKKAPAIHIRETNVDPDARPGFLGTSEWWIVPGAGLRRTCKNNDEVEYVVVKRDGQSTTWFPERNAVEIKSSHEAIGDFPYFTDATLALERFETMAKEQKIPITAEELQRNGKAIRRIQIKDLREGEQGNAALMATLIVDIDVATNRIVRKWTHEWAVGKDRNNYASLDATLVMDIDYPAPSDLPKSLFKLEYPANAKVIREDR
jgi:hypothetical protein